MPNSLRAKVKHLAHKGILKQSESDKIRAALLKEKGMKAISYFGLTTECPVCNSDLVLTPKYCYECGQKLKYEEDK